MSHLEGPVKVEHEKELYETALKLGEAGEGLQAADESIGSTEKRLQSVGKE